VHFPLGEDQRRSWRRGRSKYSFEIERVEYEIHTITKECRRACFPLEKNAQIRLRQAWRRKEKEAGKIKSRREGAVDL